MLFVILSVSGVFSLSGLQLDLGNGLGMRTVAVITDMNNPIGRAVGNSVEIVESIDFLHGKNTSKSLEDLVYSLGMKLHGCEAAFNYLCYLSIRSWKLENFVGAS